MCQKYPHASSSRGGPPPFLQLGDVKVRGPPAPTAVNLERSRRLCGCLAASDASSCTLEKQVFFASAISLSPASCAPNMPAVVDFLFSRSPYFFHIPQPHAFFVLLRLQLAATTQLSRLYRMTSIDSRHAGEPPQQLPHQHGPAAVAVAIPRVSMPPALPAVTSATPAGLPTVRIAQRVDVLRSDIFRLAEAFRQRQALHAENQAALGTVAMTMNAVCAKLCPDVRLEVEPCREPP